MEIYLLWSAEISEQVGNTKRTFGLTYTDANGVDDKVIVKVEWHEGDDVVVLYHVERELPVHRVIQPPYNESPITESKVMDFIGEELEKAGEDIEIFFDNQLKQIFSNFSLLAVRR